MYNLPAANGDNKPAHKDNRGKKPEFDLKSPKFRLSTFYTVAVYFSAVKVKNTRHAVPAALCADFTAWLVCGITVMLFFGV